MTVWQLSYEMWLLFRHQADEWVENNKPKPGGAK